MTSDRMQSYVETFRETAGAGPVWLRDLRERGMERFATLGFPTSRLEEWKFTSAAPIAKTRFRLADPRPCPDDLLAAADVGLTGPTLVFVNGHFVRSLGTAGTSGVVLRSLAEAWRDAPDSVEEDLGRIAPFGEHAFAAWNAAFLDDGALVDVGEGIRLEEPIRLLFLSVPGDEPAVAHPRVLVRLAPGAEATLVEQYAGPAGAVYLSNAVTEARIAANASLTHVKLQEEGGAAFHLATIHARQGRDSRFRSMSLSLGGALARNDIRAELGAEGAECALDGLYLARARQHVDHHTTVDHQEPHGTSRQLYKGILAGKARGVFNGRITVRPGAQKTDAGQVNRNLVLSDEALVNTNPQLEIFADDVRCTHGATIGRLDEEAVFYLRSRGVGSEEARAILIRAFAGELLERLPARDLGARLGRIVDDWFAPEAEAGRTAS